MYSVLTDLICVAFIFLLGALLFAASVAILMVVEALEFLHQKASIAFAVMNRRLASVAKPALQEAVNKNPGTPFNHGTSAVVIGKLQHES